MAIVANTNRRDYRDHPGAADCVDNAAVNMLRFADKAEIDAAFDVAVRVLLRPLHFGGANESPSLPDMPSALPPAALIQPTSSLLIAPDNTIRPPWRFLHRCGTQTIDKFAFDAKLLSIAPICGPPPWTTTGFIPTAFSSTISAAKSCASAASPMA